MSENIPRHIVMVRHGESIGDVRRASRKAGQYYPTPENTADEPQTELGHKQSILAGKWISRYVLKAYGLDQFELMLTSPTVRTKQSAASLGIKGEWIEEQLLAERNRGMIQGLPKSDHADLYPESYQQMLEDPLHWTPPGGESILEVADHARELNDQLQYFDSALLMTHRDRIWAAQMAMEGLTEQEMLSVDTNLIRNSQILHYTNVNPYDGTVGENLSWKRSVCPWTDDAEVLKASALWTRVDVEKSYVA